MFDSRISLDFFPEFEELEDVAHVLREAPDVANQVIADVGGVAFEPLKIKSRMVVETLASDSIQEHIQSVAFQVVLAPLVLRLNLALRRLQHAVEASQHGHRQHDTLVLRWPIRASQ